jgi:prepilin-type N-terminal cleavage/methylation domain-containing protein
MIERVETMKRKRQSGFTMVEVMVALVVFFAVASIVMSGMVQMMQTQAMVGNRTEMHTSVRSATELLQQEIGQAGKISLPAAVTPVTMTGPIFVLPGAAPAPQTVAISSTTNMFPRMLLDVDAGQNFEVVTVAAVTPTTITAIFSKSHGTGAVPTFPAQVSGSFGTGIVPPAAGLACATAGYTAFTNGSDCSTLKLYGDINGDGNILYVEYTCDTTTDPGFLYRNEVSNAIVVGTVKPAVNASMYLLNNVERNPAGNGCFTYQVQNATVNGVVTPFVTDVAVTLTVQTQLRDLRTNQYQRETKALLNITPRNVFYVWEATSLGEVPRNQPMPANITSLLQ